MLLALLFHVQNVAMQLAVVQDAVIRQLLGFVQIVDSKDPEVKPWDK